MRIHNKLAVEIFLQNIQTFVLITFVLQLNMLSVHSINKSQFPPSCEELNITIFNYIVYIIIMQEYDALTLV